YCVAFQERDGDVVFMRKIVPGGADCSYGIHVAKLAGLPPEVITRAQGVHAQLERSDTTIEGPSVSLEKEPPRTSLPQPHPIIEEVKQIDLFSMTQIDALNSLAHLQRRTGPTGQDNRDK